MRKIRLSAAWTAILFLSATASAQTTRATQPALPYTLAPPAAAKEGGKCPVAVVLAGAPARARVATLLGERLSAAGFYLLTFDEPANRPSPRVDEVLAAVASAAASAPIDPDRILLVGAGAEGQTALAFLEPFRKRVAGAVLLGVLPVRRVGEEVGQWAPAPETWSVPLWVTAGTEPADEAAVLVMWRRVAADAPADAPLTIDSRLDSRQDPPAPDAAIQNWLTSIAAGKAPAPGPDAQAQAEKARHAEAARAVLDAMAAAPPAAPGESLTKTEEPLSLRLSAPAGWARDPRREQPYHAEQSPYVQMYLIPERKDRPFFARVYAAAALPRDREAAGAAAILDDYAARLRRKGVLIVPHQRWTAKGFAMEVSTMLSAAGGRWHRWLVLSGAGPAEASGRAAALVLVMDASEKPDPQAMAAVVKRILGGAEARWVGSTTASAGRPDRTLRQQPQQPVRDRGGQ